MTQFEVSWSILGGWMARDMAGNALRHPALAYGELPPRFKTIAKAEDYGAKALRALAKAAA
jgi:hypothetical protein